MAVYARKLLIQQNLLQVNIVAQMAALYQDLNALTHLAQRQHQYTSAQAAIPYLVLLAIERSQPLLVAHIKIAMNGGIWLYQMAGAVKLSMN